MEQTQREKLQGGEIHRAFQKDLCRLRLTAARAYVSTITDGRQGISAVGGAASLRLHAQCQGLVRPLIHDFEPRSSLQCTILNSSAGMCCLVLERRSRSVYPQPPQAAKTRPHASPLCRYVGKMSAENQHKFTLRRCKIREARLAIFA